MDKVRQLEAVRDARPLKMHQNESVWACSLCKDWDGSGKDIETHLLNR